MHTTLLTCFTNMSCPFSWVCEAYQTLSTCRLHKMNLRRQKYSLQTLAWKKAVKRFVADVFYFPLLNHWLTISLISQTLININSVIFISQHELMHIMSVSMYVLYNKSDFKKKKKSYRCFWYYILVVVFSVLPIVLDRSHFSHCLEECIVSLSSICLLTSVVTISLPLRAKSIHGWTQFMCIVHVNMMQN